MWLLLPVETAAPAAERRRHEGEGHKGRGEPVLQLGHLETSAVPKTFSLDAQNMVGI
jgi:hypothetical protein